MEKATVFRAGYNDRGWWKVKYARNLTLACFQNRIVAMYSLRTDYDERIIETISVGVWIERPPFDVHIVSLIWSDA